jgi:carboxypeptidase family protein
MQMKVIAAAALLASLSVLQTPALAQNDGRAQLRLTVVDETNAPVPNAIVTVFTMYGPRTVNTDAKGVVVFADLPASTTIQWWARSGHLSNAEAMRLKPGENKQTLTLHTAKSLTETERSESGS